MKEMKNVVGAEKGESSIGESANQSYEESEGQKSNATKSVTQ